MEELDKKVNNRNNVIRVLLSVAILILLITGISLAAYSWRFNGTLTNQISTTGIELDFLESQDNIINITNALPMTDEEGKYQHETFDFAVTSKTKSNTSIGYTLSIEKLAADTGYTLLNDSDIKVYLEDYDGNVLVVPTLISSLSNYQLYQGSHSHNSTTESVQSKFKLRAWIDESKTNDAKNWTTTTKLQYKFKINLSASQ